MSTAVCCSVGRVMIVRQFLQWVRNAPPGERAEATSALARAYLHSDLSADDLAAAEGAMIMLLDDPSPLVRRALAEVFASAQKAPRGRRACARRRSAGDRDAGAGALAAVARSRSGRSGRHRRSRRRRPPSPSRAMLPRSLAAAIAEVGSAQACLALLENPDADIAPFSIDRIVERFGHLARDPRKPAGARRSADGDAPGAARQAVADARRLRRRAAMAGPGTRRIRGARGLREGDRRARRRHAVRGSRRAGAASARRAASSPPA